MPVLAAVALLLLLSRCTHDRPVASAAETAEPRSADVTAGVLTVAVPARAAEDSFVAHVRVGALPRGARVIVHAADTGDVLGVISPYGLQAAGAGGLYTIPVPERVVSGNNLRLRFEIQETHDAAPRPPRQGEIAGAELFAAPAKH